MLAFWKRECRSYFQSAVGYVFIAGILCMIGANTYMTCISGRMPTFERVLTSSALIFLLMVPILTMRMFAEERREGTMLFFYSMPIRLGSIVLGKYFALLTILAVPLLVSALYPVVLSLFGTLDMGIIAGTYVGFFAMGAALLAVGLFFAALLENQVAAAVATFVVLLASYAMPSLSANIPAGAFTAFLVLVAVSLIFAVIWFVLTKNSISALVVALVLCLPLCLIYRLAPTMLEGVLNNLTDALSVYSRFYTFGEGIFDVTALVYYISLTALMLFLSVQVLEYRRCR